MRLSRLAYLAGGVALAVVLGFVSSRGSSPTQADNGLTVSGEHYTLNIHGVDKVRTNATDSNGMFVPLDTGRCPKDNNNDGHNDATIKLQEGAFAVIDSNAADVECEGTFQLPNNTGVTAYTVWARALGKPGGSASMALCVTAEDGNQYCNTGGVVTLTRTPGQSLFQDATTALTKACTDDPNGNGQCDPDEQRPLFDEGLKDQYWWYDNQGLKLAQLRFYPNGSTP